MLRTTIESIKILNLFFGKRVFPLRVLYFQHGRMHYILREQDTQAKSVIRVTAMEHPLLPPLILDPCTTQSYRVL